MSEVDPWVRFSDLKREQIVTNHVTLKRWIRKQGFPPGIMLGPNTRAWRRSSIDRWLASRPEGGANPKPFNGKPRDE
jgi:Prophage CP4-57 regulatory protein (AlpA)